MIDLAVLQAQAIKLHTSVMKQTRRLREDRVRLGHLLCSIRELIGVKNKSGGFRGSNNGVFCDWLKTAGINAGSAYNWIGLAETGEWTMDKSPSRQRIKYWQAFDVKMKAAKDDAQRLTLFKAGVEKLRKQYRLKIKVSFAKS